MARNADALKTLLRLTYMSQLDGVKPTTAAAWMGLVGPVISQAAAGAGHWAAGRRQRALAEWAGAAGFGLVAWGLATEAPAVPEVQQQYRQLMSDLMSDAMRERGVTAPPAAPTQTPQARRIERFFSWFRLVVPVVWTVLSVPWRLRHPRRLTGFAIFNEAPNAVFGVLRAARAVQRRRPRIAVGSALVAAGSVARLRAASAEPLP